MIQLKAVTIPTTSMEQHERIVSECLYCLRNFFIACEAERVDFLLQFGKEREFEKYFLNLLREPFKSEVCHAKFKNYWLATLG